MCKSFHYSDRVRGTRSLIFETVAHFGSRTYPFTRSWRADPVFQAVRSGALPDRTVWCSFPRLRSHLKKGFGHAAVFLDVAGRIPKWSVTREDSRATSIARTLAPQAPHARHAEGVAEARSAVIHVTQCALPEETFAGM